MFIKSKNPYLIGIPFLFAVFILHSCSNKIVRTYGSGIDSKLKSLSSSILELRKDKTFTLKQTNTSFESVIPQGTIYEIIGTYKSIDSRLLLMPNKKRVSWVKYGSNYNANHEKKENPIDTVVTLRGSRQTAIVAIDTTFGEFKDMEAPGAIQFVKHVRPNSIYFINQDVCFYTYISSDTSHDLKNYCSDLWVRSEKDK